ncbi:hypothetical protein [Amycolatopsis coloradensis]|uniref:hypothetical protein n=1 Tax=Amycolatopsis coloradensis TaxID=76021 RepID=UPI0024470DBE|nr:hypothetical protein [Amycolatopsis coloradensis]
MSTSLRRCFHRRSDLRRQIVLPACPEAGNRSGEAFTDEHRDKLVRLGEVIDEDNFKDILFLMSRVHYRYDVPPPKPTRGSSKPVVWLTTRR